MASYRINQALQGMTDLFVMGLPRRRPSRQALANCKLISHRGEHDNRKIRENTLAAFERVHAAGVWGIEFDVRWTRDLSPVVIHDPNLRRVFDVDLEIDKVDLSELRRRVPEVPTLHEVVSRYGGELHLMVELKQDRLGVSADKRARIAEVFAALEPGDDYHFLALEPTLFEIVDFIGGRACLPVAEYNMGLLSRHALTQGLAGVSGHYLLLNDRVLLRHRRSGQKVGTGFVASRSCFYRELNRGVDWIFTNHALKLEAIRQALLRDRRGK